MAAPCVRARLAEGAHSGLANIVQQYLEQDLAEFAAKRRRAARLHGRVAMTASDHQTTVTLDFRGHEILVWDGAQPPLDASIAGPHRALIRVLRGEAHPLIEHVRGRLQVRSSLRQPFLPLRVHRLVKPGRAAEPGRRAWPWVLAAGLAVAGAAALFLYA